PNGAGKTTLIRILAILSKATSGSVWMDGFDLADESVDIRRHMGLVSHQTLLYDDLTPDENLRFYGRMYDVPDLEDRIEAVLRQVGLEGRRHDPVRTFSRGMQQRLAIARAILHRPAILLLDEPDTGLDQQAAEMLHELLATVGTKGRTVLMTTHNLERGLSMGDRVAILAGGRIAYEADKGTLDVESFREIYYRSVRGSVI
ncbi:MAG: ABC transporter ATP-binding protein, partial [Anaerolineae bacterium]